MDEIARFEIGDTVLTRVPYFDIALDPAVVNLTLADIDTHAWSHPAWATAEGSALVGQAAWVIESQGRVIVVDPCGAADAFLRAGAEAITHQDAFLAAMRAAGFEPDRVDVVFLSHLDGIGMAAAVEPDGSWRPMFPNARVVLTAAELEWLAGGETAVGIEALRALIDQQVVDGVDDGHRFTDAVWLERSGGHSPGHAVLHVDSGTEHAVFLGHLALNPVQLATVPHTIGHVDTAAAMSWFEPFLERAAREHTLLIGPLWPHPGAARVTDSGEVVAA